MGEAGRTLNSEPYIVTLSALGVLRGCIPSDA